METLAERLGHPPDTRLLIVNCDDLGFSYAANVGVFECLHSGIATSATLMVPAPWSRDAAARYRGEDIGVHLTLNAEYDLYRWGPITHAPTGTGVSPALSKTSGSTQTSTRCVASAGRRSTAQCTGVLM